MDSAIRSSQILMSRKIEQDQRISDDGYMEFLRLNGSLINSVDNFKNKLIVDSVAETRLETVTPEIVNQLDRHD